MKDRNILKRAAICNQTVTAFLQAQLMDQALDCRKQIAKKIAVFGWEIKQRAVGPLGYNQDMHRIARAGMVKRQQRGCFAQALNRDGKTHVGKPHADDPTCRAGTGQTVISLFEVNHGRLITRDGGKIMDERGNPLANVFPIVGDIYKD
jgi:hypothetical protein